MQKSTTSVKMLIVVDHSCQYYKKLREWAKIPPEMTPSNPLLVTIQISKTADIVFCHLYAPEVHLN